jgi:formimidoylglutamate deiminase
VNAAEELMLLEYGQRLALRQRNVLAHAQHHQTATAMTLAAVAGGVQAAGRATTGPSTGLALGQPADMVALDAGHHAMVGLSAPDMLSAHVFASNRTSALHSVWVGGQARVLAGRHALRESAAQAFLGARRALIAES